MTVSVETHRNGWVADDSSFGARLALVRQRMGWGNVKQAAEACGQAPESWRRWERDGRSPHNIVEIVTAVSEKTGCDFVWLLAGPKAGRREPTAGYPSGSKSVTGSSRNRRPTGTNRPPNVAHASTRPTILRRSSAA